MKICKSGGAVVSWCTMCDCAVNATIELVPKVWICSKCLQDALKALEKIETGKGINMSFLKEKLGLKVGKTYILWTKPLAFLGTVKEIHEVFVKLSPAFQIRDIYNGDLQRGDLENQDFIYLDEINLVISHSSQIHFFYEIANPLIVRKIKSKFGVSRGN